MSTLSLAMIVKNEGDTIERVLESAQRFCDEMIIVDTGSADDTCAKAKEMGAQVHHFAWVDDFAAARNFAFSRATMDWILWLDGDDVVTPANQQRIGDLKRQTVHDELEAFFLYYECPPFTQWRERIIRRALFGSKLQWRGAIHECIHGIDLSKARYRGDISILHSPPPNRSAVKQDRNLAILRKQFRDGARDERTLYIYALECLTHLRKDEAEEVVAAFFAVARYSPYKYIIYHRMYDFYMALGDPSRALDALTKALIEDPKCAEAYFKLGKHFLEMNDPRGAIPLLRAASTIALPDYGMPEVAAYTHGPWEGLSWAYFRLEDYGLARKMARNALHHDPPHSEWLRQMADYDPSDFSTRPLPDSWQTWLEDNVVRRVVPRHILIRILQDNQFDPKQIITAFQRAQAPGVRRSGD